MTIKHTKGNVIVLCDVFQKYRHKLSEELTIQIERGYNFNRREDYPSFGYCGSAEHIPQGANVLFHHNATEPTYELFNHGLELEKGYKIFSMPETMVFMYRDKEGVWQPCKDFVISLRLFTMPSSILLKQEPPQKIKNRMFIMRGSEYQGKVALTSEWCDYEIQYTENGVPGRILRTRERELFGEDTTMLEELKKGNILMGIDHKELYQWQQKQ